MQAVRVAGHCREWRIDPGAVLRGLRSKRRRMTPEIHSALRGSDKTRAYRSLYEEHELMLCRLARLETGLAFALKALEEMEVDLLSAENRDREAHRICNISRAVKRLTEGT